jgi:hypothetical protein
VRLGGVGSRTKGRADDLAAALGATLVPGDPSSLNPYTYSLANSTSTSDPSGLITPCPAMYG